MTPPRAYLGIDLGTSGLKVTLLAGDGTVAAEAERAYAVASPRTGWAETDPSVWVAALSTALAELAPAVQAHDVRAIGLDGQMHGLVLSDADGVPVRPAVLWPDTRASLAPWRALPDRLRATLANPLSPGMYGPMLNWLATHEPQAVARADVALLPKDYVRTLLTPAPVAERSDASATLLWDVAADTWSRDVAVACEIPQRLLPPIAGSAEVVGTADTACGLPLGPLAGLPVVAGAGDTPAAVLAAGVEPGRTIVNLGTGTQAIRRGAVPRPDAAPQVHTYADTERGWYTMAAAQNAGLALQWARGVLGARWDETMAALTEPVTPVQFLPFLAGERGAIAPPGATASWRGLTIVTTRADLLRAAVEAMVFQVRRCWELVGGTPDATPLPVMGGGTRAEAVVRLIADVLGTPVQRLSLRSPSACGAAMLAARGVGDTVAAAREFGPIVEPRHSPALADKYATWRAAAT